jgi:hypothetical protein
MLGVGTFAHKDILGHSKLSMTANYTHLSEETLKDNMEGFEQYLRHRHDKIKNNDSKNNLEPTNLLKFKKKQ